MIQKRACVVWMAFVLHFSVFAQPDSFTKSTTKNKFSGDNKANQAVFGELFGRSLMLSANYDRRFGNNNTGLGFTVGAGIITLIGASIISVPVSLNYLMGKNGKFLELGAGATYFNANVQNFNGSPDRGTTIVPSGTIGYRSQPTAGGFMFRAGLNQFFFEKLLLPCYPYISFGYSF